MAQKRKLGEDGDENENPKKKLKNADIYFSKAMDVMRIVCPSKRFGPSAIMARMAKCNFTLRNKSERKKLNTHLN